MKKIKIRAWDKENGKMIYSNEVFPKSIYKFEFDCFNGYDFKLMKMVDRYNVIDNECNETYQEVFESIDADIMQYTGLKDKNGKGIYEGDIVNYFRNELAEVKFINGCFAIESKHYIDCFNEIVAEREVVGNIYENPELLG